MPVSERWQSLRWRLPSPRPAAPNSPVYIVVLKGDGLFSGGDSQEERFGPGDLLIFDTGEPHAIRADKAELVFVAFLHAVPEAPWHR